MIAQKKNLDKNYIAHVSEKDGRVLYPSTIGKHIIAPNYIGHQSVQILVEQKKLIEELAAQGDCVIVGRCADLILKERDKVFETVAKIKEGTSGREDGSQIIQQHSCEMVKQYTEIQCFLF